MATITRRNILRTAGAAGVVGTAGLDKAFAEFFQPAASALYPPDSIVTSCGICDSACGIRATVKDGVIQFLQGLPEDPQGGGTLCAKGTAAAALKYDPDRLKYPMKRTNPIKGLGVDPGWMRIGWEEALDTIAQRFRSILDLHGRQALLAVSRGKPDILNRFYRSLGITRVDHNDMCYGVDIIVQKYTVGPHSFAYDLENSKYILLFGWDMMARAKLTLAKPLAEAKSRGAKVVNFNPQRTVTARFSDEWHPIRPGSDLAAALAIINVLLEENLFNREFVHNFTNFLEYESPIRDHFRHYTPEWAEGMCDVPAADLRRIAREFGTAGPSVVPVHKKTPAANYANATQTCHALSVLNILAGTIDRPGGRYFPRTISIPTLDAIYPPPAYPALPSKRVDGREQIQFAQEGNYGMFSTLASGMVDANPGQVKGLFWYGYSLLSFPDTAKTIAALKSVDFTVVVETMAADATYFADIVLPNAMYLEGSDVVPRTYRAKSPSVVVRQPLTAAPFEAKSTGWICVELGKRLAPEYFKKPDGAWINPSEVLDEQVRRAGLGADFASFRKDGFMTKQAEFVPATKFSTPSGKCQIYVPEFKAKGYAPLPNWVAKREEVSAEYPFYLVTYLPGNHKRNSTQNNAILNEISPENHALLNTATAARLGIREGQTVRLRSRIGAIELYAKLTETLRPDCVVVPHGYGHRSPLLTRAAGRGACDNLLIPAQTPAEMLAGSNFTGSGAIMDAVVQIEPA
jgi:thiosulfate reductase/polysulfide reductase chain A